MHLNVFLICLDHLTTGMFPTIRTHSSDTLDLCSMDSLSLEDEERPEKPASTTPVAIKITMPEEKTFKNCLNSSSVAPECV